MAAKTPDSAAHVRSPLLRRADQFAVGGVIVMALAAVVAWLSHHGGHRGQMIEIERAEPRPAAFLVDVNEAEWPELAQLPGIGETLARRIVASRESQGRFASAEDLRRVRGIGPLTLERLRGHLAPLPEARTVVNNSP